MKTQLSIRSAHAVWILSTSWYAETSDISFPLPRNWKLTESRDFPQDYPGEGPVRVLRYQIVGPVGASVVEGAK